MKIAFTTWRQARQSLDEIKVTGQRWPWLFLCQEGSYRRDDGTWTPGTGRWIITDDWLVPDRCALKQPCPAH